MTTSVKSQYYDLQAAILRLPRSRNIATYDFREADLRESAILIKAVILRLPRCRNIAACQSTSRKAPTSESASTRIFLLIYLLGSDCNRMASSEDYLLWGWSRFFEELSSFLQVTDRQTGIANQAFSEYVLERLETSVMSVSALIRHLQSTHSDDEEQAEAGANYQAQ